MNIQTPSLSGAASASLTPLNHQTCQTHQTGVYPDPGSPGAHRRIASARRSRRCAHVLAAGNRCGSPSMRGEDFCFYHGHYHRLPENYRLPSFDDGWGIQAAIAQVLSDIMHGYVDRRTGALLLYGLQTASANLRHLIPVPTDRIVTALPESSATAPQPLPAVPQPRLPLARLGPSHVSGGCGAGLAGTHVPAFPMPPLRGSGGAADGDNSALCGGAVRGSS